MNTIHSHCDLRLGDNLAALHFLRGLAKANPGIHFRHAARLCYLQQLIELTCDLPNLQLVDMSQRAPDSHDLWKNAGGFWEKAENKNDYEGFMRIFFAIAALRMGLEPVFFKTADLLFDYPALHKDNLPLKVDPFDVLIVNSPPLSGQWAYDATEMNTLCQSLAQRNAVITTHPTGIRGIACTATLPGFSVTNIGQLSQLCRNIVMVSTGASWPTFNVWNRDTVDFRLIFIREEQIGLTPPDKTVQCQTVAEANRVLKVRGLL